ncbi:hypothetical protein GCM10009677_30910 [Sphaerisporangium rubeum]
MGAFTDLGAAVRRLVPLGQPAPPARMRTIRFKLYSLLCLPIAALSVLWMFITGHIVGDYFELRRAVTQFDQVAMPAANLASAVMQERRLSAMLVSSDESDGGRLSDAREDTDAAVSLFHQRATSLEGLSAIGPDILADVAELERQAQGLGTIRQDVDARTLDRMRIVQEYTRIQDTLYGLYDRLVTVPEIGLFRQAAGLQTIVRSRETLSREDALLTAAILRGPLQGHERRALAEMVAGRRLLLDRGVAVLDGELRRPYDTLLDSADYRNLVALENQVLAGDGLPASAQDWQALATSVGPGLDRLTGDSQALLNDRSDATAAGMIAQIVAAGGLGLLAILIALVLSARLGRGLAQELADLRSAALELADVQLPRVVSKLRDSQAVDVESEAPPVTITGTTLEAQDVAQALTTVRRTAIEAAVGQADLRTGVSHVFRNLARRNQSLLHRQLTQLSTMQSKTDAPDTLADIFSLDHLTTRMRRQAEGLIILSGAPAGRAWRRPVPVHDVVRGAVAEVEQHARVTVLPMSDAAIAGTAVADVIHLLAELIENATVFSPPTTRVQIRGELVGRGFAVEVEDRGLGLSEEAREEINQRLADPPEFDLADSDRLGLFVVSRLAARHHAKVTLRRSPYGGTSAVVLLPTSMIILPNDNLPPDPHPAHPLAQRPSPEPHP